MFPDQLSQRPKSYVLFQAGGIFWLLAAIIGAGLFFWPGVYALLEAWQLPEYSHGPLIPVLSGFLFLRHLKRVPARDGPVTDRWVGVAVVMLALLVGSFGRLIQITDIVAYALILWIGGLLLINFGWRHGRQFWPPVLHLVYMLPLPSVLYYQMSTELQVVSSELGVFFLQLLSIPVFLEGNIIDLGVYKLQVAEACSGLRYLFPILSFSYIFAVLYRGPVWHKAVLLISAVPITIVMNSVRIAIAGLIVDRWGVASLEGFTHFFEGWVIFVVCVAILFGLARLMLFFNSDRMGLVDALDLDVSGLGAQLARLRRVQPSSALIVTAGLMLGMTVLVQSMPVRETVVVSRDPFVLFPRQLGEWVSGPAQRLEPEIVAVLKADDYRAAVFTRPGTSDRIDLFVAWYKDQANGGTHSPKVCIPGAGWEIAELEQIGSPVPFEGRPFTLNRAVIQKGVDRMLVYYWFDQQGARTASGLMAKWQLAKGKVLEGRTDGALVRLITPISKGESATVAEVRLTDMLREILPALPRFLPE